MNRLVSLALLLGVMSLTSGCAATLPTLPSPAEGGRPWIELKSNHFTLRTDLSEDEARRAITHLEATRATMLHILLPDAPAEMADRMVVVSLADGLEYEGLFGRNTWGFIRTADEGPLFALFGPPEKWERRETLSMDVGAQSVLKTGIALHLGRYALPRQPLWFARGFARYLETVSLDLGKGEAKVGLINLDMMRSYLKIRSVSVEDALTATSLDGLSDARRAGLEAMCWGLVYWMVNVHPQKLFAYRNALAKGDDPQAAWAATFGSTSPAQMGQEIHDYFKHGSYRAFDIQVPETRMRLSSRALGDDEVHALRAELALMNPHGGMADPKAKRDYAMRELAEALRHDPGSVSALRAQAWQPENEGKQVDFARLAVRVHPEDASAWSFLGDVLTANKAARGEIIDAFARAVELDGTRFHALNSLAWSLLMTGRAAEALPKAERAAQLAPWSAPVLDTLAQVQAASGRCQEAQASQERAISLLTSDEAVAEYRDTLERIKALCKPGAPQAGN
ncbi:MAG: hypothetical protein L0Y66_20635 [Myxococcaceae bacterium]|nr:hypothetical protein [Myxococcaceae bacterium]MCI0673767.1 hypothetical protein [Myxococcaceae bacterium]